ncbi:STM4011 family radical SAM protein [Deinococcus lacus]|uniref:STM4011 family radical SAM protein n=1 Tax=Deinococcus lacus TaxID=392561 RepID=A0ABW1YFL7_9DEIO
MTSRLLDPLTLLYRGPLSSCNYACPYCPFAKRTETAAQHAADAEALARFVDWAAAQTRPLSVFFTPWGEALVRWRYQEAVTRLSHLGHVGQVAIQTNLSGKLGWLEQAERSKVGLWATYHPGEVTRARFLARCAELDALGVRYSVGVVGKREHFGEIEALRAALPPQVYLWVNAFSQGPRKATSYYSPADLEFLSRIDPLFEVNTRHYPTRGKACATGETVLSVDGDGTLRRCHFVPRVLGNLYTDSLETILRPRPCPRPTCECHIGYVHLPQLEAEAVYGPGLLARIPEGTGDVGAYLARARGLL